MFFTSVSNDQVNDCRLCKSLGTEEITNLDRPYHSCKQKGTKTCKVYSRRHFQEIQLRNASTEESRLLVGLCMK